MESEESDPNKWVLSGCAILMSPEWAQSLRTLSL
jgi:hypothetical protein